MMAWEETLAFCYLQQAGDEKNKSLFTSEHFIVIYRGKVSRFALEEVKEITFNQRRWLLPLIVGGITGSFTLLAIFLNLYNPMPLFILFMVSFFAFYYGWQQHPVLTVTDKVKEHDFPLKYISSNLKAFIHFVNHHLQHKHEMIYHIAKAKDWDLAQEGKVYKPASLKTARFIHAATKHQLTKLVRSGTFTSEHQWILLTLDPLKVQAEIRYEPGDDTPGFKSQPNELFPHIYGPLNLDAIVKAEQLPSNIS